VENNLLEDGYWAGDTYDELPNIGLTVSFLIESEDVTEKVLENIDENLNEQQRQRAASINISGIVNAAVEGNHYTAEVKSFYYGSKYYLFVYETFSDVRLVGAPPETIGRFGGDTDNWIWPRHTGDFSIFRIYADKNNNPAPYSPDNIPYKPKAYLEISAAGIEEGDFTMVMGYPGNTNEYLFSGEIEVIAGTSLPAKIDMRTSKLASLEKMMNNSDEEKLFYSSRFISISNSWKRWIGVTSGIERSGTVFEKREQENEFERWATENEAGEKYVNLISDFKDFFMGYSPLYVANDLGQELLNGIDVFDIGNELLSSYYLIPDSTRAYREEITNIFVSGLREYYRTNPVETDRDVLPEYLRLFAENTDVEYHPAFYDIIKQKYKGNYVNYINEIYDNSVLTDSSRLIKLLGKSPSVIYQTLLNDPLRLVYSSFNQTLSQKVYTQLNSMKQEYNRLYRLYLTGLMEMNSEVLYYPDANFTMRVSYGKVEGYKPSDAVNYMHYTSLNGVFEKEDTSISDYLIPQELKDLYMSGDLGVYANNNNVPVCFIASNHTSGGNSGSPVFNSRGELIGINFDRNWEGTVSDYDYNPDICRNISLDIRYVLFILDKIANADSILEELTIVY